MPGPALALIAEGPRGSAEFGEFLLLGIRHIGTGYDHLLFLLGLLLVCRSFRSMVAIISSFTVAHSLTLALATVGLIHWPERLVEALIAGSIFFIGLENLLRRGAEPKGRWIVTFVFGLVHGLGFASVLQQLGVGGPGRGLLWPLFAFNLGVEVAQVAIVAVLLPLVWKLRQVPVFARLGVMALSAAVAVIGCYWLVERTFF